MSRKVYPWLMFSFSLLFLPSVPSLVAQTVSTERKMNLSFSGFVKNDFITDTRRNAESVDGLYTLWPLKPEYDADGKDIQGEWRNPADV